MREMGFGRFGNGISISIQREVFGLQSIRLASAFVAIFLGFNASAQSPDAGATMSVITAPRVSSSTVTSPRGSAPVTYPVVNASAVCPKCGRVHATTTVYTAPRATGAVGQVSGLPVVNQPPTFPGSSPTIGTASIPGSAVSQASPSSSAVNRSSRLQPLARVGGGVQNVLAALNSQRARQGLPSLRFDASLQAVAARRAQQMASMGLKSHPPGSYAPGTHEGVGWSSSYTPGAVLACYTSDPHLRVAGAAMAQGRDGVYFAVVYR